MTKSTAKTPTKNTAQVSHAAQGSAPADLRAPPMLHARWVRFLLLRGEPNARIQKLLLDDDLPAPASDVLDAMRASLVVPRGFRPVSKTHAPSRAFLQQLGLEAAFDGTAELAQALAILRAPRHREIAEASIIVSVPHWAVVETLSRLFGVKPDHGALTLYAALFFDFTTSCRVQLRLLLEERIRQLVLDVAPRLGARELRRIVAADARVMALSMPPSEIAWALVLMRFGWSPPRRELSAIIGGLESTAALRLGQALARGGRDDERRAESAAAVLERIRRIRETVQSPGDELRKRLHQFQIAHDSRSLTTVSQLRASGQDVTVDNSPPATTAWDRRDDEGGNGGPATRPP